MRLWRSIKGQDFLLYDPYCRQVQYVYEPLHDEHLAEFFRRPVNRKRVRDAGLLTADGDGAVCTLRQYNMYRQYLHRLHMDAVDKERELWDSQDQGRSVLRQAEALASRDCERAVARKLYVMKTAGRRAEQQAALQAKIDACVARMRRYDARVEQLQQQHELWVRTLPARVHALDERIRAHCRAAHERESRRVAAVLRARRDRDQQYEERQRRRREDRLHEKRMRVQMLTRIKRERLAKLRGEKPPDIVKAITKVLEETQKSAVHLQSPWVVEKFVRASLAEKKPGDIAAVLHGVKKKLERASHLPEQVLFTLDALLEGVVKEFVLKGLASMVTVTIEKALELVCKITLIWPITPNLSLAINS
ncbi:fibrous sheath-interacting protein 2 [Schistocerca americana]|uniref:fibrous sheath-interacting protein 2 n=1 Tax=Schistocerca americana TaxID=7009 RepID=UPI001F4F49E4|nr:fibrous sheath-interacting protein 2 [Schistocerca americana]